MLRLGRRLHHHAIQMRKRPHHLRSCRRHGLRLRQPRVQLSSLLKLHQLRRSVPLLPERLHQTPAARPQKRPHRRCFLRIALIRAAFEARRQALLHLRIHAPRKGRIRRQILDAPPQLEQIQHVLAEPFRRNPRRKRPIEVLHRRFCNAIGYIYAWIIVLHGHS